MAYIGKTPTVGNFQKCDAISVVNGQAGYTLQVDSVNVSPESANHCLVSLNGILQAPTDSYTISGSTITFASNLATGDVIDFVIILGNVLDLGVPSDATVTNAKTNFVSTSSAAGLQIKGDNTTAGTLQLNCEQNSHGVKLRSPAHSSGQSYTLTLPTGNVTADKFLKVASVSGSGATGVGQLSFADAGGGKVLQIVSAVDNTTRSTTSTSFVTASNTCSCAITPAATSSKVLLMFNSDIYLPNADGAITIYRDSTNLGHAQFGFDYLHEGGNLRQSTIIHLDSPNTTSQVTYQIYLRKVSGSNSASIGNNTDISSLQAIEIGA